MRHLHGLGDPHGGAGLGLHAAARARRRARRAGRRRLGEERGALLGRRARPRRERGLRRRGRRPRRRPPSAFGRLADDLFGRRVDDVVGAVAGLDPLAADEQAVRTVRSGSRGRSSVDLRCRVHGAERARSQHADGVAADELVDRLGVRCPISFWPSRGCAATSVGVRVVGLEA